MSRNNQKKRGGRRRREEIFSSLHLFPPPFFFGEWEFTVCWQSVLTHRTRRKTWSSLSCPLPNCLISFDAFRSSWTAIFQSLVEETGVKHFATVSDILCSEEAMAPCLDRLRAGEKTSKPESSLYALTVEIGDYLTWGVRHMLTELRPCIFMSGRVYI